MSDGRTWTLFGVTLLYAIGIGLYVTISTPAALNRTHSADFNPIFGIISLLNMFGPALAFMLLVAVLDFVTQRKQQIIAALSIGLAATATYEGVVQVAFMRSMAYYKTTPPAPSVPASSPASPNQ